MPSKEIIARIPSNSWVPVTEILAICTELVGNHELPDYSLTFETDGFTISPYLQLSLNHEDQYLMEITSNNFLEPKVKPEKFSLLESFGWLPPSGNNPNYSRVFERGHSPLAIAAYSLAVFRMTFDVNGKGTMRFSSASLNSLVSLGRSFEPAPDGGFRLSQTN
jgi:hypothetical protein